MNVSATLAEIASLPISDRMFLVEAIWDTIIAEPNQPDISDAMKQELDKRLAAHAASPDDVIPWKEAKAKALARIHP